MPLEVHKGGSLFVRRGPVDASEFFCVQLLTERGGFLVAKFERQRNRLADDVIRGQQVIGETKVLEGVEHAKQRS